MTLRKQIRDVMARAMFDAEWDKPGNPAPESQREEQWRVFQPRYVMMAEAAHTRPSGIKAARSPRNRRAL